MIKNWIDAARLRTLPLAVSVVLMGAFLAKSRGFFSWPILIFCVLTTLFLQILSNFANDFGDTDNGADNELRTGPVRAVQSGKITKKKMLGGIVVMTVLSFASGLTLLDLSFGYVNEKFIFFLFLGVVAIVAAIKYTVGKNPYGYQGLGDISVLIFFGWIGVLGSNFLFTHKFYGSDILPATAIGLFSVAVLHLNNLRDIKSDTLANKKTLVVRYGYEFGKLYLVLLIGVGWLFCFLYMLIRNNYNGILLIQVPSFIMFKYIALPVYNSRLGDKLDGYLGKMAFSTLLMVAAFGIVA
jgi:1,4-dihydroxy-2-naphthoate octaprenyltransferase